MRRLETSVSCQTSLGLVFCGSTLCAQLPEGLCTRAGVRGSDRLSLLEPRGLRVSRAAGWEEHEWPPQRAAGVAWCVTPGAGWGWHSPVARADVAVVTPLCSLPVREGRGWSAAGQEGGLASGRSWGRTRLSEGGCEWVLRRCRHQAWEAFQVEGQQARGCLESGWAPGSRHQWRCPGSTRVLVWVGCA